MKTYLISYSIGQKIYIFSAQLPSSENNVTKDTGKHTSTYYKLM